MVLGIPRWVFVPLIVTCVMGPIGFYHGGFYGLLNVIAATTVTQIFWEITHG